MKLAKAKEILGLRIKSPFVRANPDTKDAIKLGIEALRREESWRRLHPHLPIQPLWGETED